MSYQILGDVHTHTFFSRHAYSTIAENVAEARAMGLTFLGSADHFGNMLFDEQTIKNFQYFTNVGVWPRDWRGIAVLRACEADICSLEGRLFGQDVPVRANIVDHPLSAEKSLYEMVTSGLDYVVASVHNRDFAEGCTVAQGTEMYERVLEAPEVFIIGHPGRSGVPFDIDEVLTCAKERHKLIEINEHTFVQGRAYPICQTIAERCAELGVGIEVSTDAHVCMEVGRFGHAQEMLERIHFPQELIANRSLDAFLEALAAAGVCDLREEFAR